MLHANHLFVDGHVVVAKSPIVSVDCLSGQCVKSVKLYCNSLDFIMISFSFMECSLLNGKKFS